MNDEPSEGVRELATKLFAAARAERPGPALGRRLLLIQPPGAAAPAGNMPARTSEVRELVRERATVAGRSRWAVGFAAAAFAAGVLGLWLSSEGEPAISISPEREAGRHVESAARASGAASGAASVALEPRAGDAVAETAARAGDEGAASERAVAPVGSARSAGEGSRGSGARRGEGTGAGSLGRGSSRAARSSVAAATPVASSADAKPMALTDELALLKEARAALRSRDAQHALELLDRHTAARTSNALLAEATLLRIEALAALGRGDEAGALASQFVRDNPHSALSDRAKSFIVTPGRTAQ